MRRRSMLLAVLGTFMALSIAAPSFAAAANWDFLGSRKVNWFLDHDTIRVGIIRGSFDRLLIKVRGNDLYMANMKVVYRNGTVQNVPLRFHFNQGSTSRVIQLAGVNNRVIRNIQMTYGKPINGNGPTWVEVFGRH